MNHKKREQQRRRDRARRDVLERRWRRLGAQLKHPPRPSPIHVLAYELTRSFVEGSK